MSLGLIIDIAFGVIALIALIVGIKKGFMKQLTGFLNGILTLAGSIAVAYFVLPLLQKLELFGTFSATAAGWFTNEIFAVEITSAEQLAETLSGGGAWSILASLSEKIYEYMTTLGVSTIGTLFGFVAASAITAFALWLIAFLLIKLLLNLLKKLLLKFAALPFVRTIDKILGAIWSVAITYVVIVGILLTGAEIIVLKFLPSTLDKLTGIISQSSVLTLLNDTNVIGSWLAGFLQMELPKIAVAAE